MIFLYPVQRQMFPRSAYFTSSSVGFKLFCNNAVPAITMPGIQKPH